jgi:hypothetical protein
VFNYLSANSITKIEIIIERIERFKVLKKLKYEFG